MIDIVGMATAVTVTLGPFLPVLIQSTGKLTDIIAERAGEAAWGKAHALWEKITQHWGDDAAVTGAAAVVADDPEDTDAQKQLAKVLAKRLEASPDVAEELQALLGGSERIQEMIAGNQGVIEYVEQWLKGAGRQHIRTGDAGVIRGVFQGQID